MIKIQDKCECSMHFVSNQHFNVLLTVWPWQVGRMLGIKNLKIYLYLATWYICKHSSNTQRVHLFIIQIKTYTSSMSNAVLTKYIMSKENNLVPLLSKINKSNIFSLKKYTHLYRLRYAVICTCQQSCICFFMKKLTSVDLNY